MKGKSVETALHTLISCVEPGIRRQEYTLAAFLDIEGAFNNILSEAIIGAMREQNVDESVVRWIGNMLESRLVSGEIAGITLRRSVRRGTPQGGVISPLLWLLVVDSLLKTLERNGVTVVGYADVIAILVNGKFPDVMSDLMERALTTVKSWTEENGLGVNASKTVLLLFSKRHNLPNFDLPKLDGVELELEPTGQVKYLGVIIDRKLNWRANIEERRKKALIAWYTCYRCIGRKWGLKPKLIRWLYLAVVRPILTYGSLVWWHATKKKTKLDRLMNVQRQACIGITGALRTTATTSLEVILNIMPIDIHIVGLAYNSALRLSSLGLFKACNSRFSHGSILSESTFQESDYTIKEVSFESIVETKFPERDLWSLGQVIRDGEMQVYTNGSKTENGTGSGIFIEELDIRRSYKLSDSCTVFQAEVHALLMAAETLLDTGVNGREISLYVDSQAAIMAIGTSTTYSRVVRECRKKISDLTKNNSVRVCWVPGHEDYVGNEEADKLAKAGAESTVICNRVKPPILATLGIFRKTNRLVSGWVDGKLLMIVKLQKFSGPPSTLKRQKIY